jgi:hypothetical protein
MSYTILDVVALTFLVGIATLKVRFKYQNRSSSGSMPTRVSIDLSPTVDEVEAIDGVEAID